ncbi:MAG: hypothetical protein L0212_02250 [Acidobacteria bacterium]|nr:hypothetical protein [Acidobacteriota bacterium]
MRRTRFMTLFFLALSVAFFCVKEFRWGLCSQSLLFLMEGAEDSPARRLGRMCLAPEEDFSALGSAAEQSGDAAALAFAALHPGPDGGDNRMRWADLAVAKDPQYTWVYNHLVSRRMHEAGEPGVAEQLAPLAEKMTAWDPENAAVWLQRAELLRGRTKDWPRRSATLTPDSPYFQGLAAQTEWLAAMERALAAPRYDTYVQKRFELERAVLREQGWASPSAMLLFLTAYPIPNLLNLREYADFRIKRLGAQAEQARRLDDALGHYRTVATFGRRMRLSGKTLIEELIGVAVERIGTEPLLAAAKKANRREEVAQLELAQQELQRVHNRARGEDPLALSSMYYWSSLLVIVSGLLVFLFSALTLVCVGYVNLKQWIRPEKHGRIYQLMTVAENYLPVMLFLSCAALYLVYRPYATNFQHYLTASGEITNFEPFFFNVFPNPFILPRGYYLPVESPFGDYVWWALGFGLAAAIVGGLQELRARRNRASLGR